MAWMHSAVLLAAVSGMGASGTGTSAAGPTVLVDFSTQWCGPCRQMAPIVEQLAAQGYPVRTVDGDQHPELVAKYRVGGYPCFVMLVDGREVDRVVGATSQQRLVQMLEAAGMGPQRATAASHVGPAANANAGRRAIATNPASAIGRNRSRPQARAQSPDNVAISPPRVTFPSQASETPLVGSPPSTASSGQRPSRMTFADDAANSTAVATSAQQNAPPAAAKSAGAPASQSAATPATAAQTALAASVRLKIEDSRGNSVGSGTIIDARDGEALILTCGHIFRESKGEGTIRVDLFGDRAPRGITGQLVGYSLERDVGLVSIRPGAAVTAARLAPTEHKVRPGDSVISVGCDNGRDATARASRVNSIDKFLGPSTPFGPKNLQVAGQPVEGRSGGGLFTPEGLVIGVCNAADPTDNEGLFAALGSIRAELDELNLSQLIAGDAGPASAGQAVVPQAASGHAGASADTSGNSADSLAVREPPAMPRRMPRLLDREGVVQTSSETADTALATAARSEATPAEAAVLSEIRGGGDAAEVICIVRSLKDPRAKSEVIVLDRASPEFMRQLSADRRVQSARHLTSQRKPAK